MSVASGCAAWQAVSSAVKLSVQTVSSVVSLPGFVNLDTVHTETVVAHGVDRAGKPIEPILEIPEGQAEFVVHSILSDLRPGKSYEYSLEITDGRGRPVLGPEDKTTRTFTANAGEVDVWRTIQPDWKRHGPGRWEISSGVGGQRAIDALYVVPRFAQQGPGPTRPAPAGSDLWFHLGLASHVTPGDDPKPVDDLKKVSAGRSRVYVYVQLHDLELDRRYECDYIVRNASGDTVLKESRIFTPRLSTWILTSELELPRFFGAGTWQIEATADGVRASRKFQVER